MRVTLKEIAEIAKVSRVTVSRVANQHPNIREKTRRRVLETMERLNYSPHPAAKALGRMKNKSKSGVQRVAFLFSMEQIKLQSVEPLFTKVLDGSEDYFRSHETCLIVRGLSVRDHQTQAKSIVPQDLADGYIFFCSGERDRPLIEYFRNNGIPLILVLPRVIFPDTLSVTIDNMTGAYAAVRHLIEQGHTRIAYIGPSDDDMDGSERRRAYQIALLEAGIDLDSDYCLSGGEFRFQTGYQGMERLLVKKRPPTAVFAADDTIAIGVMNCCIDRNLNLPRDLSIIGFDNMFPEQRTTPNLTTVEYDYKSMGRIAAEELTMAIRGETLPKRVVIPTHLIVRSSVTAPKV